MLIDTHAHLANDLLINQIDQVLENAKSADVGKIISIGCTIDEIHKSIELAEKYPQIYATAGLYPYDDKSDSSLTWTLKNKLEKVESFAQNPKVVAIGEAGLDFTPPSHHEIDRTIQDQTYLFQAQIDIAKALNKPLVIHSRNAVSETIQILEANKNSGVNFVWHCFSEGQQIAEQVVGMGCMISITGIVTYNSGHNLKTAVKVVPIESIMIETDSPYLVPDKARKDGVKTNEPAYVRMIAQEIADIKGISIEEVIEKTNQNATQFFNIK